MSRGFFFVVVCVSLAACHTDLQGPAGGGEASPEQLGGPAGLATEPVAAPASVRDADTDEQDTDAQDGDDHVDGQGGDGQGNAQGGASSDDDTNDNDTNDDNTNDGGGGLLPPAELEQACSVWQDCGPNFGDRNSGFDCQDGQCACNVAGDYDEACAAIGGLWSDAQCFCFVTSSRPPEEADPDETDPVTCWWDYYRDCEADEWVDTSYYRNECDDGGCRRVYVRRGYWREGHCDDVWVRECSDGTRQTFR